VWEDDNGPRSEKYGRTIANVVLPDSTSVDHTLVKDGWCWWYRQYAPGDAILEGLEKDAREAKKGLSLNPQPIPPWEWRKLGRALGSWNFRPTLGKIQPGRKLTAPHFDLPGQFSTTIKNICLNRELA
jgi:nuclease-like protein